MTIKKAMLINPPTGLYVRDDRCQGPVKWVSVLRMPLDLAAMAATLRQVGVECKLVDYPAEHRNLDGLEQGLFREEELYSESNQYKSGLRTLYLSSDELDKLRERSEKSILFNPSYIFRAISQIRSQKYFLII